MRFPSMPRVGPFDPAAFRSPLRGPWLASFLSAALAPLVLICAATGFLSHAAYDTELQFNSLFGGAGPGNGVDLYGWDWPTDPAWLYAATQGLHIITGLAAIPILLAKLWTVIPKLWENPPVRSIAHGLERASLALLVGGALFVFSTGVLNIQLYYPFQFRFVPSHYYAAIVFLAALGVHLFIKVPVALRAFRQEGVLRPLRDDLEHTEPEPGLPGEHTSAPEAPASPTLSRRALLAGVGAGSAGLAIMGAGQVVGGPFRDLALLTPRGRTQPGPNGFPVNKSFASVGIDRSLVGPDWRLTLRADGETRTRLARDALLALPQTTARLPIACVEGWSTTQEWTGVRLSELARMAEMEGAQVLTVRSLQPSGAFSRASLNRGQLEDDRSLLALRVNDADLSLDHGFPARIIVPALPGVHCTKWVASLNFRSSA